MTNVYWQNTSQSGYNLLMLALLILSLAPYTGPALAGSIPNTSKFSLSVAGSPGKAVELRTTGVPAGYIASFCTDRVCSPFRIRLMLPPSGRQQIELQFIQNVSEARKPSVVTVVARSGARATIAFNQGTH